MCGIRMLSLVQGSRPLRQRSPTVAAADLMTLPCPSAQTVSKYNSQYHKLFQTVPKEEILMKGKSAKPCFAVPIYSISVLVFFNTLPIFITHYPKPDLSVRGQANLICSL